MNKKIIRDIKIPKEAAHALKLFIEQTYDHRANEYLKKLNLTDELAWEIFTKLIGSSQYREAIIGWTHHIEAKLSETDSKNNQLKRTTFNK